MMPQLDKFTYFTQFFWLCLIFFTFYISLCRDGVPRISRILKPRNQLVPHQQRGKPRNDPNSLEEILGRGFSTGVSYMYSSLFEVSQWCDADLQGRKKITYISCFGERSGSRRIERNVSYLIPKSSYHTCSSLSEVRLCYFIELPSSMMDYADLCFFLKDIIQKVGVGYRIILTQKESPYKSADGLSSELILGLEGLELNKQVIHGFVSHKKEVGKIGITKLKSFHRLCSLVMAEKDNEYPLVCWGVSSEEVAARSLASRQKIGLKQAAIKTFRGESRNRPTAIPAISSYVEEAPKLAGISGWDLL